MIFSLCFNYIFLDTRFFIRNILDLAFFTCISIRFFCIFWSIHSHFYMKYFAFLHEILHDVCVFSGVSIRIFIRNTSRSLCIFWSIHSHFYKKYFKFVFSGVSIRIFIRNISRSMCIFCSIHSHFYKKYFTEFVYFLECPFAFL